MIRYANPELKIYGSVANSLFYDSISDLDLTLLVDDFKIDHEALLSELRKELQNKSRF